MKNVIKQIKQIFSDNKDYFIRCTIMSLIAGLILGISISLVVSASAADEPTESDQAVIPSGIYTWNDNITIPNSDFDAVSLPFSIVPIEILYGATPYMITTLPTFTNISVVSSNILGQDEPYARLIYYVGPYDSESSYHWQNFNIMAYPPSSSLAEAVVFASFGALYPNNDNNWSPRFRSDAGGLTSFPNIDATGFGKTIEVLRSTSVNQDFATWFNANTTYQGGGIEEPEPNQYSIEAGFYKVRDNFTTAGWPVTDDSIDFRYYSPYQQSYIEAEGMAFLIENDIVSIWYMDDNVYADGWNNDAAKNIEITSDITVEPEFFTVFNNIFAPSSQGSNDFDAGYAAGYDDGFSVGLDAGYTQGYYDGMADSSGNFFTDILGGVLGSLDAFTLFGGYSLLDLITTLLGGFALIWILKLLAGG